jgi:hypothetical protein
MARKERMLTNHMVALSSHYGDKLKSLKFDEAKIIENDNDSVISHSITKKIGFVTRHLLTAECTHSIVFEKEWYERL